MGQNISENDSQTLIYQTDDNSIRVDVHLEDESVWLTQAQMAILLENTVVWKFRTTASDSKSNETKHYNLLEGAASL